MSMTPAIRFPSPGILFQRTEVSGESAPLSHSSMPEITTMMEDQNWFSW